jgi:diguanylate cyclase (GGDEF)-like protein/PAS domain S-box-containing protein
MCMNSLSTLGLPHLPDIAEAAPLGVLVCDAKGTITFVNSLIESMLGYSNEQLVGQPVEFLVPVAKRQRHQQDRLVFMQSGKSRTMGQGQTLFALHAKGHEVPVEIGITTVNTHDNPHAVVFIVDVSDRHCEEQRVRQLMESMPFGLLMADEKGIIQMTNDELNRIFGYEASVLIGQPVEVLIPDRMREGHVHFRQAFSKIAQTRRMGSGRELMAIRHNGMEFPAEIALTPLHNDGKVRILVVIVDVSHRKQLENALRRQSLYDSLTLLPNRNLFFDRLEQACIKHARQQAPFAVLMMDLNRFKEVNDTLGHPVGDAVLHEVGQRLVQVMRKSDSIARLGGDEFAVLLHGLTKPEDATSLAEKMVECLRTPILVDKHALSVGISIGIALCPRHGTDQTSLLAHADHAMYLAKRSIRCIVVDDTPPGQTLPPPQAITTEVENALQRNEFSLFFQPKIDLLDGRLLGAEALIRWIRPTIGVITPLEFIPVVEDSNMLEKFTFMTLQLALAQLHDFDMHGEPLNIAVNLSARMLEHDQLVTQLVTMITDYGVNPQHLTLEITETALVLNPVKARRTIDILEEFGVHFSVDDFGAGFTSFKYLKTFRIAEIKIDQEFTTGIQNDSFDAHLVKSIAGFCHGLGIRLVAEGIESESDLQILRALGCKIGQGYHIARPMPIDEFKRWRASRKA